MERGLTGGNELIFEADIKWCIRMGSKRHSRFAGEILRFAIFVAHGIADLRAQPKTINNFSFPSFHFHRSSQEGFLDATYMHVYQLPISL